MTSAQYLEPVKIAGTIRRAELKIASFVEPEGSMVNKWQAATIRF
jgi:hypothetical protein